MKSRRVQARTACFGFLAAALAGYALMCVLPTALAEDGASQTAQALEEKTAVVPIPGGIEGKISLDLRNIDVIDALKFLATKATINIIYTKNVAGRVTLMVENAPVKDVFDIMLRSNGLAYTKEGDIYNVMTEEEYKLLKGRKFSDLRQVRVFRIKYAIPEQAFSMMDMLKSEIGRVLVEPDSGTALIMDTPENIKRIEDALTTLEEKNMVQVFNLKYAKAKDVEEQLKLQLDAKKVGSIKADERSNQVIVQTLPERMGRIGELIEALDQKTKQVLIDTKIIKVKLSDDLSRGIEWEGIMSLGKQLGFTYLGSYPFGAVQSATAAWRSRLQVLQDNAAGLTPGSVGSIPFSGFTTNYAGGTPGTFTEKMHLGLISRTRDIDLFIKYLQTIGNTQVLSNPKLAVINNQEARIHVGERQAYVTTTTTTGQTTTTVSESVTFVDVGIQLAVTPTINDEGYVRMKVKPEISSVVGTLVTPSNNRIPIIDTSMAETTVLVKDGTTIIIGGLRKDEKTRSDEQVPILGKIPMIGFLFRSGSNKTERTELLVMITPHIVTGDALTTGDEREMEHKPGKEYREYRPFVDQTDFIPPTELPEEKTKPYHEYTSAKREDRERENTVTFKGDEKRYE
jgi:general secretion pathway protein D